MKIDPLTPVQNLFTKTPPGVKIELVKLPTGEIIVTDPPKTKAEIITEKYPDLIGQGITASDAAKKYGVNRDTIYRWNKKSYIETVEQEPIVLFNEAEIAYCVDVYKTRNRYPGGGPLLDENGLPYSLKWPELSKYRHNKSVP